MNATMDGFLSPLATAIVSAAIIAFATTALGKVGGWLLLAVAIGLLIIAAQRRTTTGVR